MWFWTEFAATIVEAFLQYWCLHTVFNTKYGTVTDVLSFSAAVFIQSTAVTIVENIKVINIIAAAVIYVALAMLYAVIFLKGGFFKKLFINCLIEVAIIISVLLTVPFISTIMSVDYSDVLYSQDFARVLVLIITKLIFAYFTLIIIKFFKKSEQGLSTLEWVLIASVFLCTFVIGIVLIYFMYSIQMTAVNSILIQVILLAFVAVNILTLYIVNKISLKSSEITRLKVRDVLIEQQRNQIGQIDLKYKEMRKIRHDYKNVISCVISLIDSGQTEKAKKYLTDRLEIGESLSGKDFVAVSNPIIGAVINSKILLCHQKKIDIKCSIFSDFDGVDADSLSVALFNSLDNAIEAEEEVPSPHIELEIKKTGGYLSVKVSNKITSSVLHNNKDLITTKKNKEIHGIGVSRIKEMVEKQNGMADFYETGGYFVCRILMSIKTSIG